MLFHPISLLIVLSTEIHTLAQLYIPVTTYISKISKRIYVITITIIISNFKMNKNHIALSIQFFIITFIYVHAMLHSTPTPNANNESDSYAVSI